MSAANGDKLHCLAGDCPKCETRVFLQIGHFAARYDCPPLRRVACSQCGMCGPVAKDVPTAKREWNTYIANGKDETQDV